MKRVCIPLLALMVALCACNKKAEPLPPLPPPPPPPTSGEDLAKTALDQLNLLLTPSTPDATLAKQALAAERSKMKNEINNLKAEIIISNNLKGKLKIAREGKQWHYVKALCQVLADLDPKDLQVERSLEEADLELQKPQVKISGKYEQSGDIYWFLTITFPATGKVETTQQRKGDEFFDLRLVDIVGDNKGIKIEYMKTGETFEVPYQE